MPLHRRSLLCTLSASLLLASCALSPDQASRRLLVGPWEHTVGIMGERRTSQLVFADDGTFLQTGHAESRGLRVGYAPASGTWSLHGSTLEMRYRPEQTGNRAPPAQTDVRRIIRLSETEFVSADARFGIELAYTRSKPR